MTAFRRKDRTVSRRMKRESPQNGTVLLRVAVARPRQSHRL
jgi:hypothetical protein